MPAKLHINLRLGIIEAEGEPNFVETVYNDFKDEALKRLASATLNPPEDEEVEDDEKPAATNGKNGAKQKTSLRGKIKSSGPSCAARILELKTKKAFAKDGLTADAVRAKLKAEGHTYNSSHVGAALNSLHRRSELRRTDKDGKWLYLEP